MRQALLPLIPDGAAEVNRFISVAQQDGQWTYFAGTSPIFSHPEGDRRSFQMFTAQLIAQGTCRPAEIIRTFGVSKNSVMRSVKKYREEGIEAFFAPRRGRGPTVMTDEVTAQAQELLQRGVSRSEVAKELGIPYDTLRKAINLGRLHEPPRAENAAPVGVVSDGGENAVSDKSERGVEDAVAANLLGTACTRPIERVAASLGLLGGAPTRFEACRDVTFGGVLCASPPWLRTGCLPI